MSVKARRRNFRKWRRKADTRAMNRIKSMSLDEAVKTAPDMINSLVTKVDQRVMEDLRETSVTLGRYVGLMSTVRGRIRILFLGERA